MKWFWGIFFVALLISAVSSVLTYDNQRTVLGFCGVVSALAFLCFVIKRFVNHLRKVKLEIRSGTYKESGESGCGFLLAFLFLLFFFVVPFANYLWSHWNFFNFFTLFLVLFFTLLSLGVSLYALDRFFQLVAAAIITKTASFKVKTTSIKAKMVLLAVLAYLLMCALCVANCEFWRYDEEFAAALEVTILFGWAFWEVFLLTKTPNRNELSRRKKLYSVLSFLAVPLVGLFCVVCLGAYKKYEFLNLTLLVFAPAAFFATKICYRLHEAVNKYLEDSDDGTA